MNRVKKLLDEAASNILRVTFERGPNGEFSFKGFNPEPPKAELHLPAVDGHVSEMKESSSKESADSGFTEGIGIRYKDFFKTQKTSKMGKKATEKKARVSSLLIPYLLEKAVALSKFVNIFCFSFFRKWCS